MIRALWRYSTIDLSCSNLELSVSARSNRALAFSSLPLAWGFGCIIGPLIGGVLARPHKLYVLWLCCGVDGEWGDCCQVFAVGDPCCASFHTLCLRWQVSRCVMGNLRNVPVPPSLPCVCDDANIRLLGCVQGLEGRHPRPPSVHVLPPTRLRRGPPGRQPTQRRRTVGWWAQRLFRPQRTCIAACVVPPTSCAGHHVLRLDSALM